MKTKVFRNDFIREFKKSSRSDNFSNQGLYALFDYFNEVEELTGEEIELDIIAICCDYNETTKTEFLDYYPRFQDYKEENIEGDGDSADNDAFFEYLNDKGINFIPIDDWDDPDPAFIYQVF